MLYWKPITKVRNEYLCSAERIPKSYLTLATCTITEPGQRKKKIARFGFTTARGPSSAESK